MSVCQDFTWVESRPKWQDLNALVKVETRSPLRKDETRYYICSLQDLETKQAFDLARGHWASENKLHWQLDLTFLEDKQRHRTDKAPENLALIRKIVLNTIQIKEKKLSKKKVLKKMAWNEKYCLQMLKSIFAT